MVRRTPVQDPTKVDAMGHPCVQHRIKLQTPSSRACFIKISTIHFWLGYVSPATPSKLLTWWFKVGASVLLGETYPRARPHKGGCYGPPLRATQDQSPSTWACFIKITTIHSWPKCGSYKNKNTKVTKLVMWFSEAGALCRAMKFGYILRHIASSVQMPTKLFGNPPEQSRFFETSETKWSLKRVHAHCLASFRASHSAVPSSHCNLQYELSLLPCNSPKKNHTCITFHTASTAGKVSKKHLACRSQMNTERFSFHRRSFSMLLVQIDLHSFSTLVLPKAKSIIRFT